MFICTLSFMVALQVCMWQVCVECKPKVHSQCAHCACTHSSPCIDEIHHIVRQRYRTDDDQAHVCAIKSFTHWRRRQKKRRTKSIWCRFISSLNFFFIFFCPCVWARFFTHSVPFHVLRQPEWIWKKKWRKKINKHNPELRIEWVVLAHVIIVYFRIWTLATTTTTAAQ